MVESYIAWVGHKGHARLFADIVRETGNDPHAIFDALYRSLDVKSFGRLAKFDYLSLIGRYSIAPIDAGSAYLSGATGPKKGARLLFDGRREAHPHRRSCRTCWMRSMLICSHDEGHGGRPLQLAEEPQSLHPFQGLAQRSLNFRPGPVTLQEVQPVARDVCRCCNCPTIRPGATPRILQTVSRRPCRNSNRQTPPIARRYDAGTRELVRLLLALVKIRVVHVHERLCSMEQQVT